MKKSHREVPVQKGTIISNPPTMKQMPYSERAAERSREMHETRRGQTLDYKSPRKK